MSFELTNVPSKSKIIYLIMGAPPYKSLLIPITVTLFEILYY